MMTESMQTTLKHYIVNNEEYSKFPYTDTKGNITIGIGYNLSARGMPDSWVNNQYNDDVTYHYNNLVDTYPWFLKLSEARQIVLIDMCFNLGWKGFQEFKNLIDALSENDFVRAKYEILHSLLHKDAPDRTESNAKIMEKGEI
jgi:lysozyme